MKSPRTFISPFEIITGSVYSNASQYYKPVFVTGYNPEDEEDSESKNRFFAMGGNGSSNEDGIVAQMRVSDVDRRRFQEAGLFSTNGFSDVAGKGKLCKGSGLTGAEKTACAKNITVKCGKKPTCSSSMILAIATGGISTAGIPPKKCKAKQEAWEDCASALVISPEQAAKDAAEELVPSTPDDLGMSIGVKLMIGAAALGTLTLIGFAISNKIKANKVAANVTK